MNDLFRQVIARACPDLIPAPARVGLLQAAPPASANRVYVLSRITLGADVAVTSVLLDAAKRRYPDAEIVFVGPRKSTKCLRPIRASSICPRPTREAEHWSTACAPRQPLVRRRHRDRSRFAPHAARLDFVCDEDRYFFFNSRVYGGDGSESLPALAARWARRSFRRRNARALRRALSIERPARRHHGQSRRRRESGQAHRWRFRARSAARAGRNRRDRFWSTKAAAPRSASASNARSCQECAPTTELSRPSRRKSRGSKLFVGYDSAGSHVASACGVPLISIAKGFVSERMFARWRPKGTVIRGDSRRSVLGPGPRRDLHVHSAVDVQHVRR